MSWGWRGLSRWAGCAGGEKRHLNTEAAGLLEAGRHPGKQVALLLEAEEAGKVSLSLRGLLSGLLIPGKEPREQAAQREISKGWGSWSWQGHLKGCLLRWTQASWPALWMISPPLQPPGSAAPRHPSAPSTYKLRAPSAWTRTPQRTLISKGWK